MELEDLKNNMACLNRCLSSDNNMDINIDPKNRRRQAKSRIYNNYLRGAVASLILGVVYLASGFGGLDTLSFPQSFRIFIGVYLLSGATAYVILAFMIKRIDIAGLTPIQTAKSIASFRKLVIITETVLGIGLIVFFTLFLAHLTTVTQYKFWIVLSAIVITIVLGLTFYLPRKIKDFKDLSGMAQ